MKPFDLFMARMLEHYRLALKASMDAPQPTSDYTNIPNFQKVLLQALTSKDQKLSPVSIKMAFLSFFLALLVFSADKNAEDQFWEQELDKVLAEVLKRASVNIDKK